MDLAAKGAAALAGTDQAADAVRWYTMALLESPTSPDYYTQRSMAFGRTKPPQHVLALKDAEYAIVFAQRRAKREKIQAGQHRRLVALYGLGRYEEAKQVLQAMEKWRKKDDKKDKMEHDMWMAKINMKLKGLEPTGVTIKEYPEIDLLSGGALTKWLQSQLDVEDISSVGSSTRLPGAEKQTNVQDTLSMDKSRSGDAGNEFNLDDRLSKTDLTSAKAEPTHQPATTHVRYDFYQNNNNVIVTFYAKKVDKDKFHYDLGSDSIVLSFPHPESSNDAYTFSANPTFAPIDTQESSFKVFGTKIELVLAKQEKGLKWSSLEATGRPVITKLPNPYSSVSKDVDDWDRVASELGKREPKKKEKQSTNESGSNGEVSDVESDYEGGDPVDGFFKKLYAGADEDTRKAMIKSFTESNGTSLSTNWADVSQGEVKEEKPQST